MCLQAVLSFMAFATGLVVYYAFAAVVQKLLEAIVHHINVQNMLKKIDRFWIWLTRSQSGKGRVFFFFSLR